jgi:hypothetical protein
LVYAEVSLLVPFVKEVGISVLGKEEHVFVGGMALILLAIFAFWASKWVLGDKNYGAHRIIGIFQLQKNFGCLPFIVTLFHKEVLRTLTEVISLSYKPLDEVKFVRINLHGDLKFVIFKLFSEALEALANRVEFCLRKGLLEARVDYFV